MGTFIALLVIAAFVAFWVIVSAPLWVSLATITAGMLGIWIGWRESM